MENTLNPLALPQETFVKLLKKSGCHEMSQEYLQKLIDVGLPLNGDGSVSILEYIAWLIREVNGNESNASASI